MTTSCCFVAPRKTTQKVPATRAIFDDDDGSIWDTLLRNGPISFGIRVARPDFYEETVVTYMETKGVDRLEAQRRMDFMFNDPNGFGVNELREEQLGEKINYNVKSGVQNRPVFSAFWAAWCARDLVEVAVRTFGSVFTHADDMHLYWNMGSLLVKGVLLEDRLGSEALAVFVAFSIVASSAPFTNRTGNVVATCSSLGGGAIPLTPTKPRTPGVRSAASRPTRQPSE